MKQAIIVILLGSSIVANGTLFATNLSKNKTISTWKKAFDISEQTREIQKDTISILNRTIKTKEESITILTEIKETLTNRINQEHSVNEALLETLNKCETDRLTRCGKED